MPLHPKIKELNDLLSKLEEGDRMHVVGGEYWGGMWEYSDSGVLVMKDGVLWLEDGYEEHHMEDFMLYCEKVNAYRKDGTSLHWSLN